jgi:UDP-N-acetylmuramoyl-tripeptide--D-alanyl-D-alanine ligase
MKIEREDIFKLKFDRIINVSDFSSICGVSIDSRLTGKNEIFFALKGTNYDGHDFVKAALDRGAAFAVVNAEWFKNNEENFNNEKIMTVKDTVITIGELAALYRKKFNFPIIAITGSNGKTTTKDMVFSVLAKKYKVLKTEGNFNNHIGVPLMMFKLSGKYDMAVIEIGTNHFGEIKYLCKILQPDYGLITNVGKSHLEFFKDINGVRKAKGELFDYLSKTGGTGFINSDDINIVKESKKLEYKKTYGFNGEFDYTGLLPLKNDAGKFLVKYDKTKKLNISLKILGSHNMINALAAASIGLNFNVKPEDIAKALLNFKPSSKRMERITINSIRFINDCYNSNPDSVKAALNTLSNTKVKGKKIAVLGDMLEIGSKTEEEHAKIADMIIKSGIEYIFLYGPLSKNTLKGLIGRVKFSKHYLSKDELATELFELVGKNDLILLKGSRGMKMETILAKNN